MASAAPSNGESQADLLNRAQTGRGGWAGEIQSRNHRSRPAPPPRAGRCAASSTLAALRVNDSRKADSGLMENCGLSMSDRTLSDFERIAIETDPCTPFEFGSQMVWILISPEERIRLDGTGDSQAVSTVEGLRIFSTGETYTLYGSTGVPELRVDRAAKELSIPEADKALAADVAEWAAAIGDTRQGHRDCRLIRHHRPARLLGRTGQRGQVWFVRVCRPGLVT